LRSTDNRYLEKLKLLISNYETDPATRRKNKYDWTTLHHYSFSFQWWRGDEKNQDKNPNTYYFRIISDPKIPIRNFETITVKFTKTDWINFKTTCEKFIKLKNENYQSTEHFFDDHSDGIAKINYKIFYLNDLDIDQILFDVNPTFIPKVNHNYFWFLLAIIPVFIFLFILFLKRKSIIIKWGRKT
jgi:hypothetical protein